MRQSRCSDKLSRRNAVAAGRSAIETSLTIAAHLEPRRRAQFLCEFLEREALETVSHGQGSIGAAATTNAPESPVDVAATALEIALRQINRPEAMSISRRAALVLASALDGKRDEEHVIPCTGHLVTLTESLDQAEASRICAPVARKLASQVLEATERENLETALLTLAPRLNSSDARDVAGIFLKKLLREPSVNTSQPMPQALIALSDRIDPIEARRFYSRLAERLALTVQKRTNADDQKGSIAWLAAIAKRIDSGDLQQPGNQVIQILKTAVESEKSPEARASFAWGLARFRRGLVEREPPGSAGPWLRTLSPRSEQLPVKTRGSHSSEESARSPFDLRRLRPSRSFDSSPLE